MKEGCNARSAAGSQGRRFQSLKIVDPLPARLATRATTHANQSAFNQRQPATIPALPHPIESALIVSLGRHLAAQGKNDIFEGETACGGAFKAPELDCRSLLVGARYGRQGIE